MPVPVTKSAFTHLVGASSDGLNIQTDLSRIPPYDKLRKLYLRQRVAYSDVQLDLFMSRPGRLGAGRAVFYKNKYVKGCGRTPLAMNWNTPNLSSGHLSCTRALREFFFSQLAVANGLSDCLVPCEAVMAKAADKNLFLGKVGEGDFALDSRFQALSIKPGRFIRASNLAYLLSSLANRSSEDAPSQLSASVDHFLSVLYHALQDDLGAVEMPPPDLSAVDWSEVFSRFSENTLARILKATWGGMFLGSYPNNFTLQGRFLDIELGMLVGSPSVCMLSTTKVPFITVDSRAIPFQPGLIRQVYEIFFSWLAHQLRCLCSLSLVPPRLKKGIKRVLNGFRVLQDSWILNRREFVVACEQYGAARAPLAIADPLRRITRHSVGIPCRPMAVRLSLASDTPMAGGEHGPSWLYVLDAHTPQGDFEFLESRIDSASRLENLADLRALCGIRQRPTPA